MTPRVSIIMPTFNDAATIAESVSSVVHQTFQDWELLIVDDASKDSTREVLRQFEHDNRVRVISLSVNSGSGYARNVAIGQAEGEYLAVLDADDIALPERIARQVSEMDADSSLAALATQVAEFGEWGGPIPGRWPTSERDVRARQRALKMPIPHPSTMFRANEVRAVGGYDVRCRRAQDFALLLKLSDKRVGCLDEVLVHYRTDRPVPISYVIRNGRYAQLARDRFYLARAGVPEVDLPQEPNSSLRTDLRSVKDWVVRNLQERMGV